MRQHHHQTNHDQADDGDNFDHREPEFHLTKHFHRGEVEDQQQNDYRQRCHPVG
ncbi:hypothetical protein D3C73_1674650 [compost metagenome]